MGRKIRVEYAGAIYHVMNRGNRRQPIFRDDEDRQRFKQASKRQFSLLTQARRWQWMIEFK
jgi:hypothetical protein